MIDHLSNSNSDKVRAEQLFILVLVIWDPKIVRACANNKFFH